MTPKPLQDQLADALRDVLEVPNEHRPERVWEEARKALAAYEESKRPPETTFQGYIISLPRLADCLLDEEEEA